MNQVAIDSPPQTVDPEQKSKTNPSLLNSDEVPKSYTKSLQDEPELDDEGDLIKRKSKVDQNCLIDQWEMRRRVAAMDIFMHYDTSNQMFIDRDAMESILKELKSYGSERLD